MPHPLKGYHTADGARCPGVTTIISKFREAGGLVHWAWQLGIEGKDYRKVRDEAAGVGTLAHAMVEAWIKHEPPPPIPEEQRGQAMQAYGSFREWADQCRLVVEKTEVSLVSERYRFGGCLDALLISQKRAIGDWKTSNAVYVDALYQLGGYGILWDEHHPDDPILGGYHLMRFAKDFPDFHHHHWGDLTEAREGFLLMRRLYDIAATLEKRVK